MRELNENSSLVNPPMIEVYPDNTVPQNEFSEYTQEELEEIAKWLASEFSSNKKKNQKPKKDEQTYNL